MQKITLSKLSTIFRHRVIWFSVPLAFVGVAGILFARAAPYQASLEPERGVVTGPATVVPAGDASGDSAVAFHEVAQTPGGAITHGEQLTRSMVGYQALGVTQGQLESVTVGGERISTWPTHGRPSWIPGTPYVYNNDPSNHGGVVPAGGMVIDGFFVPEGVWVSQFQDYDSSMIVEGDAGGTGWAGIVFRGCRYRGPSTAPGFVADHTAVGDGKMWFLYCDMGGAGAQNTDFNEVPLKISKLPSVVYRNYISRTTTGIQVNAHNTEVLENYVEYLTFYYGETGPAGNNGPVHMNGFTTNGGIENIRIERNKIIAPSPDEAGRTISQTDCISFFQDFGDYPGTGMNSNGTVGYQVLDNYLGGTGYVIYGGLDGAQTQGSVRNMVITGNKITTQWWQNGGYYGPAAYVPQNGTFGNVWQHNTWADGPNAGNEI